MVRRGFTSQSYYSALTFHTGDSSSACSCKAGGACHCCKPRKSAPKRRRKSTATDDHHASRNSPARQQSIPSSQVLARIAELRPVLPRPPNRSPHAAGPMHDPSSKQSHPIRHPIRDNLLYSPYGRAYDMSHVQEHTFARSDAQGQDSPQDFPRNTLNYPESTNLSEIPSNVQSWLSTSESFPSACKCGDQCACPGCLEHNGGQAREPGAPVFSSCVNPGACSHCLDCTILSLPSSVPPNTDLSMYDPMEAQTIDEWIRQISAQADSSPSMPLPPNLSMTPSSPWETYQLPPLPGPRRGALSECCGGRCKCPARSCTCPQDCCGCCQGCECGEHEANNPLGVGEGTSTTFATSRERGACCSGGMKKATRSLESFDLQASSNISPGPLPRRMSHGAYLEVPDAYRSRSPPSLLQPTYPMEFQHIFATPRPQLPTGLPSSSGSSSSTSSVRNYIPSPDLDVYAASAPDSEHSSSDDQHYRSCSRGDHSSSLDGMQLF